MHNHFSKNVHQFQSFGVGNVVPLPLSIEKFDPHYPRIKKYPNTKNECTYGSHTTMGDFVKVAG
jgi:hypothetical protein